MAQLTANMVEAINPSVAMLLPMADILTSKNVYVPTMRSDISARRYINELGSS